MAMHNGDRLAELLCSRLCHDLISPLGAITNGLELIAEGDTTVIDEAIAMIGSSARQGTARLSYFRLAFGAGGGEQGVGFGAIRKVVSDYFEDRKLPVSWEAPLPGDQTPMDRLAVKLILNLLLVAGESALRGASLTVTLSADPANHRMSISVRGGRFKLREDVSSGFVPNLVDDAVTVRNVIAWHCQRLAERLGHQLTVVEDGQNSLDFTVT